MFQLAAETSDSQIWPSCSSPSPVTTTALMRRPFRRSASTIPLALEMPIPSEPVLATIPGVDTSGWPGSPSSRLRRWINASGSRPAAIITA